jgi:hypothetical protein
LPITPKTAGWGLLTVCGSMASEICPILARLRAIRQLS